MSYHSNIFTNKEFRKFFTAEELHRLQLVHIGPPCKLKGMAKRKGDTIKVFTSDFVATVVLKNG